MSGMMFDEDALLAAADLVRRTGAVDFQIGYAGEDAPPGTPNWWCHAQYRGARVSVDGHVDPPAAAEALARQLLDGGVCMGCGQKITLTDQDGDGWCRWTRVGRNWTKGCPDDAVQPTRARLAQALGQIPGMPADMVQRAGRGYYDEWFGPLAAPLVQLVSDLRGLASRPATPRNSRPLVRELADQVIDGKFDASKAESDAWAATPEGQEAMRMLQEMGLMEKDPPP